MGLLTCLKVQYFGKDCGENACFWRHYYKKRKSPIWSSLVLPCKSYLLVTNVQLLNRLIASHYIASKTAGPYLKIHKQWFYWKLFMFLVSVIYLFQVTIMQCCRYLQCKSLMRLISRKNSSHLITQFIINKLIPSRELFHLWIWKSYLPSNAMRYWRQKVQTLPYCFFIW